MAEKEDEWTFQITVVRHGETTENRNGIIQGQKDTLLNDEGKHQVQLVSQRLKNEYFTRVYSSDLSRASRTAEGICLGSKFCRSNKICLDPLLRERSFGVAEGKSLSKLKALREKGETVDKAETVQCLEKRAKTFFEKLLKEVSEELRTTDEGVPVHVLIVSHGGWIRCLVKHFAKSFPCYFPVERNKLGRKTSPNTGVSMFIVTVNNQQVKTIECSMYHDKNHLLQQ